MNQRLNCQVSITQTVLHFFLLWKVMGSNLPIRGMFDFQVYEGH